MIEDRAIHLIGLKYIKCGNTIVLHDRYVIIFVFVMERN